MLNMEKIYELPLDWDSQNISPERLERLQELLAQHGSSAKVQTAASHDEASLKTQGTIHLDATDLPLIIQALQLSSD